MNHRWKTAATFVPAFAVLAVVFSYAFIGELEEWTQQANGHSVLTYNRYDCAYVASLLSAALLTPWLGVALLDLLRLARRDEWFDRVPEGAPTTDPIERRRSARVAVVTLLIAPAVAQVMVTSKAMHGGACLEHRDYRIGWCGHLLGHPPAYPPSGFEGPWTLCGLVDEPAPPSDRCASDPHAQSSPTFGLNVWYVPYVTPWLIVAASVTTVALSGASLLVIANGERSPLVAHWARRRRRSLAGVGKLATDDAPDRRWDVFLAHATPDKAQVRALRDALEARQVRCWFDEKQIHSGDDFTRRMSDGVRASTLFVPVFSAAFMSAKWAQREVHTAIWLQLAAEDAQLPPVPRIVPVRRDDVAISTLVDVFPELHTTSVTAWTKDGVALVADAIEAALRSARVADSERPEPGGLSESRAPAQPASPPHDTGEPPPHRS